MQSVNAKICYAAMYTCCVSLQLQNTRGILLCWTRNWSDGGWIKLCSTFMQSRVSSANFTWGSWQSDEVSILSITVRAKWTLSIETLYVENVTITHKKNANLMHTFIISTTVLTFWRRNYFFFILAQSVYKMLIIQEPNKLELWNKLHFEEKKNGEYISCLKYSVPIFVE
jgi:hypothetical protein